MYENEHHPVFSDGEGPFVTGALAGEQAWEAGPSAHVIALAPSASFVSAQAQQALNLTRAAIIAGSIEI